MGRAEVEARIHRVESEIHNLEASRGTYENMNAKINDAMYKLATAKNHINKACELLEKNYQSDMASKKVTEFEKECTHIDNVIKSLNGLLNASYNKINSINSSIHHRENELRNLWAEWHGWMERERNPYGY